MHNTCGKDVNSVWDGRRKSVEARPQVVVSNIIRTMTAVYNHSFVPVLTSLFPHGYPQVFSIKSHPLLYMFSPLSTLPITITTNLKNQER